MIKKIFCVFTAGLLCIALSGCTLAVPEKEKSEAEKICGVWIVVSKDNEEEIDPDGFKDKNAIVLTVSRPASDEAYHWDSRGRISDVHYDVSFKDGDAEDVTSYVFSGNVYINSGKEVYVKVIKLYKDANGKIHSNQTGACWVVLNEDSPSCKQTDSASYSETFEGKTTKDEFKFEINYEIINPLKYIKITFLTDGLKILGQESYKEKDLYGKSGMSVNAPVSCKLVLVEETRIKEDKSIETKYFAYSRNDANEKNIIEHPCAVQMPGMVADKININIKLPTAK